VKRIKAEMLSALLCGGESKATIQTASDLFDKHMNTVEIDPIFPGPSTIQCPCVSPDKVKEGEELINGVLGKKTRWTVDAPGHLGWYRWIFRVEPCSMGYDEHVPGDKDGHYFNMTRHNCRSKVLDIKEYQNSVHVATYHYIPYRKVTTWDSVAKAT